MAFVDMYFRISILGGVQTSLLPWGHRPGLTLRCFYPVIQTVQSGVRCIRARFHSCQEDNPPMTGQCFHPSQFDLSRRRHCFQFAQNDLSSKWNPRWGCRCCSSHCLPLLAFLSWRGHLQIQHLFKVLFSVENMWSWGKLCIILLKGLYLSFENSLRKRDSGERKSYLLAQKALHGTKLLNVRSAR